MIVLATSGARCLSQCGCVHNGATNISHAACRLTVKVQEGRGNGNDPWVTKPGVQAVYKWKVRETYCPSH